MLTIWEVKTMRVRCHEGVCYEIPEGAKSIRLPDSRFVRIVAINVGDEAYAKALQSPFEDLHRDNEFIEKFTKPEAVTQK